MTRIKLMNTYVDCLTMKETLYEIETIIEKKKPTQHVVINANKVNMMYKDDLLKQIVNSANLINADGFSILLAGKVLNKPVVERVTGIDIFVELLNLCNEKEYRPFFLGATCEVIKSLEKKLSIDYPRIPFAGFHHGYFENRDDEIVNEIRKSNADILFLGFSSPYKEYWASKYLEELNVPFIMGVGGSFDVIAGKTKRAPIWMQRLGMEWFFRYLQEPKRMFNRYFIGNVVFLKHLYEEKKLIKK
ncbi:TPA: WecB/TagA/CpsF family glycosyltransferase [Enterococcus faecalis]